MRRVIIKSFLLALIISMAIAQPAVAYIDPNTGGVLFQVLAAGFAVFSGVALVFSRQIRMAFARARRFLRSLRDRDGQEGANPQEPPEHAGAPDE